MEARFKESKDMYEMMKNIRILDELSLSEKLNIILWNNIGNFVLSYDINNEVKAVIKSEAGQRFTTLKTDRCGNTWLLEFLSGSVKVLNRHLARIKEFEGGEGNIYDETSDLIVVGKQWTVCSMGDSLITVFATKTMKSLLVLELPVGEDIDNFLRLLLADDRRHIYSLLKVEDRYYIAAYEVYKRRWAQIDIDPLIKEYLTEYNAYQVTDACLPGKDNRFITLSVTAGKKRKGMQILCIFNLDLIERKICEHLKIVLKHPSQMNTGKMSRNRSWDGSGFFVNLGDRIDLYSDKLELLSTHSAVTKYQIINYLNNRLVDEH